MRIESQFFKEIARQILDLDRSARRNGDQRTQDVSNFANVAGPRMLEEQPPDFLAQFLLLANAKRFLLFAHQMRDQPQTVGPRPKRRQPQLNAV